MDKEQTSQTSLHQNSDTSIGRCVEDTEDQPKLTVPCLEDESDTSFSSSDRQAPAAEVPGYQQSDRCALQVEMLHHIQRRRQTTLLSCVCPQIPGSYNDVGLLRRMGAQGTRGCILLEGVGCENTKYSSSADVERLTHQAQPPGTATRHSHLAPPLMLLIAAPIARS